MSNGKATISKVVNKYMQEMYTEIRNRLSDGEVGNRITSAICSEIYRDFFSNDNSRTELLDYGNDTIKYSFSMHEWKLVFGIIQEIKKAILDNLRDTDSSVYTASARLLNHFISYISPTLKEKTSLLVFPPVDEHKTIERLNISKSVLFKFEGTDIDNLEFKVSVNKFSKALRQDVYGLNCNTITLNDSDYRAIYADLDLLLGYVRHSVQNILDTLCLSKKLTEFISKNEAVNLGAPLTTFSSTLEKALRGKPLGVASNGRYQKLLIGVRYMPSNRIHKGLVESLRYKGAEDDFFNPKFKDIYTPTAYTAVRNLYLFASSADRPYVEKCYMVEATDFIETVKRFTISIKAVSPELYGLLTKLLIHGRKVRAYLETDEFSPFVNNALTSKALLNAITEVPESYSMLDVLLQAE